MKLHKGIVFGVVIMAGVYLTLFTAWQVVAVYLGGLLLGGFLVINGFPGYSASAPISPRTPYGSSYELRNQWAHFAMPRPVRLDEQVTMEVDDANPSILMLYYGNGETWCSENAGETWRQTVSEIPYPVYAPAPQAVAIPTPSPAPTPPPPDVTRLRDIQSKVVWDADRFPELNKAHRPVHPSDS